MSSNSLDKKIHQLMWPHITALENENKKIAPKQPEVLGNNILHTDEFDQVDHGLHLFL